MSWASILASERLLDWPAVLVGLRRGWMGTSEVVEYATSVLCDVDESEGVDSTVIDLAAADPVDESYIEDRLVSLVGRLPETLEGTSLRRWLYAALLEVDRAGLEDDEMLLRAQALYAEFGFPELLRYVSPYNLTPQERDGDLQLGSQTSSPIWWLDRVLDELGLELRGGTSG